MTDNMIVNTQINDNKNNRNIPGGVNDVDGGGIGESIKNLSTVIKLAKFKKSHLAESKKSILAKYKNSDLLKAYFIKANFFKIDFLTSETKKVFIHLQKAFIETLILFYFNSKYYIYIETNASEYAIIGVLSPMISN